eukprot:CAMPEP_0171326240 /NCGR_PEP_ID=MMETSP0816-20121228/117325_1 /TAXON_ID=420281 /ORGANISM="Proboscia inermis, Strain CCAP1064/1" /LENGTH=63 /DNA_ID=CAMNT_0011825645 /DNA_START=1071 /DNA_END=1262 /DNA_ORIENTATION=-
MAIQMTVGVEPELEPGIWGYLTWIGCVRHWNTIIKLVAKVVIGMVTVVNPGNPTGFTIPLELM